MSKREYSLLLRLYNDRKQYKHAHTIGALIEYYNSTDIGKALRKDFGYTSWSSIYDRLCSMRVPSIFYGRESTLFDFYTHNGSKLIRNRT